MDKSSEPKWLGQTEKAEEMTLASLLVNNDFESSFDLQAILNQEHHDSSVSDSQPTLKDNDAIGVSPSLVELWSLDYQLPASDNASQFIESSSMGFACPSSGIPGSCGLNNVIDHSTAALSLQTVPNCNTGFVTSGPVNSSHGGIFVNSNDFVNRNHIQPVNHLISLPSSDPVVDSRFSGHFENTGSGVHDSYLPTQAECPHSSNLGFLPPLALSTCNYEAPAEESGSAMHYSIDSDPLLCSNSANPTNVGQPHQPPSLAHDLNTNCPPESFQRVMDWETGPVSDFMVAQSDSGMPGTSFQPVVERASSIESESAIARDGIAAPSPSAQSCSSFDQSCSSTVFPSPGFAERGRGRRPYRLVRKEIKMSGDYMEKRRRNNESVRRSREKSRAASVLSQEKMDALVKENSELKLRLELSEKKYSLLKTVLYQKARKNRKH